jgi:5-methylcytosine-specific restriction endonuclease McrA
MISLDELYERDGGVCQIGSHPMSREDATRDHIRPKARGGGDGNHNIQLACGPCNWAKGAKGSRWDFLPDWAPVGVRRRSVL